MRVYLAGPITGLTYNGATNWREQVALELADMGHIGVSPMRGKDYLREVYQDKELSKGTMTGYGQHGGALPALSLTSEIELQKAYEQFPMSGEQGIFGRDTFDVRHCEVILANFEGADKVSIGTVMEVQRGYDLDRYVIVIMANNSVHDHPFVRRAASIVVPTLEDAMHVIGAMGGPYRG